jgi:hypothetical protein
VLKKIAFILLIFSSSFCNGQDSVTTEYKFIYDKHQSEFFGSENLRTIHFGIYRFQDSCIPHKFNDEKTFVKKVSGGLYRFSKTFLLDFQIDYLIGLSQHELFGHGARYREFGYIKSSYQINMPFPFGSGGGFARSGELKKGYRITTSESISTSLSGNEGNLVLSNDLSTQILISGNIHYRQALLYLITQNNQLGYIWITKLKNKDPIFSSNDIESYLFTLNNFYYFKSNKLINIEKLADQSLISILHPIQLLSVYTILYNYGWKGESGNSNIPMIRFGEIKYLPAFNYHLTPFGPEYHFINYLKSKQKLFIADFHKGDETHNEFYGLGISAHNILTGNGFNVNVHLNGWNQPELELEYYGGRDNSNKSGYSVKAEVNFLPIKNNTKSGLYLLAGYKTKGYVMGEALDEAFILRFGIYMNP